MMSDCRLDVLALSETKVKIKMILVVLLGPLRSQKLRFRSQKLNLISI